MDVTFASFAGRASGYLALPESGHGPGVVLIQEWWGLVPHIKDVADRLAAEGFVVLAPDHYRGRSTTEPDEAGKLMMGLNVVAAAEDIAGAAEYLLTLDEVDGDTIGVIGFCMGGGLALLGPTAYRHIDRAVAFYPAMPWPSYAPNWTRYAGKQALIHTCESDQPRTGAVIEEYAQKIRAAGGAVEIAYHPGTQHAFFNDSRPEVYDASASATAWVQTLEFLRP